MMKDKDKENIWKAARGYTTHLVDKQGNPNKINH